MRILQAQNYKTNYDAHEKINQNAYNTLESLHCLNSEVDFIGNAQSFKTLKNMHFNFSESDSRVISDRIQIIAYRKGFTSLSASLTSTRPRASSIFSRITADWSPTLPLPSPARRREAARVRPIQIYNTSIIIARRSLFSINNIDAAINYDSGLK